MKLYLYVREADEFLRGDYRWSLQVSDAKDFIPGTYFPAGEINVNLDVDIDALRNHALGIIDEAETETRAEFEVKMGLLKEKKQNLLSITHQPLSIA